MARRSSEKAYPIDCAADLLLHRRFERQVYSTPNNIAVVFADEYLTYEELNNKANNVAAHMRTFTTLELFIIKSSKIIFKCSPTFTQVRLVIAISA